MLSQVPDLNALAEHLNNPVLGPRDHIISIFPKLLCTLGLRQSLLYISVLNGNPQALSHSILELKKASELPTFSFWR